MELFKMQKGPLFKYLIPLIVIFQFLMFSCNQKELDVNIEKIKLFEQKIDYPYVASEQRSSVVIKNMNEIKEGMSIDKTIALLTNPDEVNLTYSNIKNNFITGFSLVYLLKRDVENGSVNEKDERLLRIHFNKSKKIIWSYSINISEYKAIEKKHIQNIKSF